MQGIPERISRLEWGDFKLAPMANGSHVSLIETSEVSTLKTGSLQRFSVQPTRAFSEMISNVNISFCT